MGFVEGVLFAAGCLCRCKTRSSICCATCNGNTASLITHNLGVNYFAEMERGRIVERSSTEAIFDHSQQDYTPKLPDAVPSFNPDHRKLAPVARQAQHDERVANCLFLFVPSLARGLMLVAFSSLEKRSVNILTASRWSL